MSDERLVFEPDVIGPLTATGMSRARGTETVESNHIVAFTKAKRASSPTDDESLVPAEVSPTLNSFDNAGESRSTVLAFHPTQTPVSGDVSPALGTTSGGMGDTHATAVRRLTPTECERLMGWPDDHTRWRADGTELADSTRYRMCGNGVASPVAEWIADMLNQALTKEAHRG